MNTLVFVVVPAYNEARVIRSTLGPLIRTNHSIVVVDDGSTDNTWAILAELPVYSLRHPINLGQGAALQTGTTFALQRNAEIIVHLDADGQHGVEDIDGLVEPLRKGEAQVALGSRFLRKGDQASVPLPRQVMLRGAVIVNGLMTGMWLTDAHNGFRALTREAAQKIYLRENGYAHASEILMQIRRYQLRYVERPVRIRYSDYSLGKGQPIWNALNVFFDVVLRRIFP